VTVSGGTATTRVWIVEVEVDLSNGAVLDQAVSQKGTGTAVTSPSATTTAANEYLLGSVAHDTDIYPPSANYPWADIGSGDWYFMAIEEQIVSSSGNYYASWTFGASEEWAAIMTSYKSAAGAGTSLTPGVGAQGLSGAAGFMDFGVIVPTEVDT